MNPTDVLQAVGTALGFAIAAFYSRRSDKQTRAIGNGWADDVTKRLGRIEEKQDKHEQRIQSLEDER